MGILKKQSGLYDKEQSSVDEQSAADKYSKIANYSKLSKSLKDQLTLGGCGSLSTGDLTISVDAPWQDCVIDTMAPSAMKPWPAAKEIRASISVPFRLGINAGQDELDRVLEYAKKQIAMEIAEKLVASGAVRIDHQVMHEYEFGQDRLVLEGSLTVV
jgi:hypothetical protein